jgi:hypothetical protein
MARLSDTQMTDMMVDVETTGTNPAFAAVIQIGAIKFNYETGEIGGTFNRCLEMAPGRFWDDGTRAFWNKQPAHVLTDIIKRAEPPEQVLRDFALFATDGAPHRGYRFWSKPLSFDWGMIDSHMRQYNFQMPFAFWQARDLRSFIAGLLGCPHNVDMDHITLPGDAHNALYDCALQLKQLFAAKEGDFNLKVADAAA